MTHEIPCKFFTLGNCMRGASCRFAHVGASACTVASSKQAPICQYFLNGCCAYGDSCFNRHEYSDSSGSFPAAAAVIETGFGKSASASAVLTHHKGSSSSAQLTDDLQRMLDAGDLTEAQAKNLMPRIEFVVQPGLDAGATEPPPSADAYAALPPDPRTQVECGICMNCPAQSDATSKYGLMEGCDHAFCLHCIMSWRKLASKKKGADGTEEYSSVSKTKAHRGCPICRQHSDFVVASELHLTGEERQTYIANFRARCSQIPCARFDKGKGKCPFGASCFYAHRLPNGEDYKPEQRRKRAQRRQQQELLMSDLDDETDNLLQLLSVMNAFDFSDSSDEDWY